MALLNYALSLADLQSKGGLNYSLMDQWSNNDKLKLILTGDKHIITHGVDLLADYAAGSRGLVPNYNATGEYAIFGKNGWAQLDINYLPFSKSINKSDSNSYVDTLIPTNKAVVTYVENYVENYVGEFVKAAETMRFMGVISVEGNNYSYVKVGESESQSGFPTKCQIGDTYRVGTNGNYVGVLCEAGDMLICIKDGSGNSLNSSDHWTVIQTNINASSNITLNGSANPLKVYSNGGADLSFYAPSNAGTSGNILVSTGATPEWKNPDSITVGKATTAENLKDKPVITAIDNKIAITVGGKTSESFTVPFATKASNADTATTATTADKVANSLTIGEGLLFLGSTETTYNGLVARTLLLNAATKTSLGGVKIKSENSYLNIDNGELSVNSDELLAKVSADIADIDYTIAASNNNDNSANLNLKLKEAVKASIALSGANGITVESKDNSSISLTLNTASAEGQGGIKLGYTLDEVGKNYPVQLSDGKAFVHVPWTDVNNTWRAVKINNTTEVFGTSVNEAQPLNLVNSNSITVSADEGAIKFIAKLKEKGGLSVTDNGIGLTASGVTVGNYGPTANVAQSSGNNATINIPVISVDEYGRIIQAGSYSFTAVDTTYTNGEGLALANNQFSLNKATDTTLGGVRIGYTTSGRNYAVQLDDNTGKAFVNVPWENNNTYREIKVGNKTLLESTNLDALTFTGSGKTTVSGENGTINISSTWRDILIGNTSIGDQSLKFVPTGDIYVKGDSTTDNVYELSFGLSWYNISAEGEDKYEYVQ